ncbi:MAG: hypothetical protein AAF734_03290 [Bacteroidota bacterium]
MEAKENKITVQRTARYYTLGDVGNEAITDIWLVCHGYGQLAQYFIKHFATARQAHQLIVAPEALSRFYWNGFSGRVGASWMTKDLREAEIEDYVNYIETIKQQVTNATIGRSLRWHVLGFSQGCATVCRWLTATSTRPATLVLWAGTFPHDLDYSAFASLLKETHITVVYGTEDEFFTEANFQQHLAEIREKGLTFDVKKFEGKHELNAPLIKQLMHLTPLD